MLRPTPPAWRKWIARGAGAGAVVAVVSLRRRVAGRLTSTSRTCAAFRALETEAGSRALFLDPFAEALAGPVIDKLRTGANQSRLDRIAVRTRYIDDAIQSSLRGGVEQIVILGAGMDTRAFRLRADPLARGVFEVDAADVLKEKEAIMRRSFGDPPLALTVRRAAVPHDLRDSGGLLAKLKAAGYKPAKPTLWVLEGVLQYLSERDVTALLKRLASASATGSWLVATIPSEELVRDARSSGDEVGRCWRWGSNDPRAFLADHGGGWRVDDISDPGTQGRRYGRMLPPGGWGTPGDLNLSLAAQSTEATSSRHTAAGAGGQFYVRASMPPARLKGS